MTCDNPECACSTDTPKGEIPTNEEICTQAIEGAEQAINILMHIATSGSETVAVAASKELLHFYWQVHGC